MIIKLTPPQVAEYWEPIKYSIIHGDLVADKNKQIILNESLHALLSERAQCFIRLADDRKIIAVMMTRIGISPITDDKFLFIQCIFSFRSVDKEDWKIDWNYVLEFAKHSGCKYIQAESANERIFEITELIDFKEAYRTFKYFL